MSKRSRKITTYKSMVRVRTGAGHGSTNTKIRRIETTIRIIGKAISVTHSATDGTSFTINENGIYGISYTDSYTGGVTLHGITLNSTTLTGDIDGEGANIVATQHVAAANHNSNCAATVYLEVGDIIRAHTRGVNDATTSVFFSITKVS